MNWLESKEGPDSLEMFAEVVRDPRRWLLGWKQLTGKRVIGCLPMYVPEELVHALGMLPVTLQGTDRTIDLAHSYVYPHLCHPVRANLELALSGELDYLDGLIIPDICDQAIRIGNLWRLCQPRPLSLFHHLRIPACTETPPANAYLLAELNGLKKALEQMAGHPLRTEDLRNSIALYQRHRSLLKKLYRTRRERPELFTAQEVQSILAAAMVMPREDHYHLFSQYLSLKMGEQPLSRAGLRLLLVGSPCEDLEPGLAEAIDSMGGLVVGDDVWVGSRYFASETPALGDPMESLVEAYLHGIPSPTKYQPPLSWAEYVVGLARESGAQAVLVLVPQFCEVYEFEVPRLARHLSEACIPHLILDTEHSGFTSQLRTRLETFFETLR